MQTLLPARIRLTGNIPDPTGPLLAGSVVDPAAASKALRAALTTTIDNATEVERLAELVRTGGASATETGDRTELETVSAANGCDVHANDMAEAENLHLPPQQNSLVRNPRPSEDAQTIDRAEAENLQLSPQQDNWSRDSCTSENVQAIDMAEAENLQLSPQRDSWVRNARPSEDAQTIDRAEAENLQLSPQQDNWSRDSCTSENVQAIDMAEAENLQLSPQQDSWTRNASTSEIYSVHELWTDSGVATVEAPHAERAETSRQMERGVATPTILELHDRLGSFIKR